MAVSGSFIFKRSISEGEEGGDTGQDPLPLLLLAGHLEHHHEVGRVARRRKGSSPRNHLVNRTVVHAVLGSLPVRLGQELHHRQRRVQLLRGRVRNYLPLLVPLGALEEQPVNVAPVRGLLCDVLWLQVEVVELEGQLVDGDHVLPGVVLKSSGEESLREKETCVDECVPEIQKHLGVPWSIHS